MAEIHSLLILMTNEGDTNRIQIEGCLSIDEAISILMERKLSGGGTNNHQENENAMVKDIQRPASTS